MTEKEFDIGVIKALIELYKEVELEIQSLGEDVLREHDPAILERKTKIKKYICDYVQSFLPGYAYASHMDISEIEEDIIKNVR